MGAQKKPNSEQPVFRKCHLWDDEEYGHNNVSLCL